MNPRILKKLSKRVVALGLYHEGELYTETDRFECVEYSPRGASRKPSHRNARFPWDGPDDRHRMGDMRVLKGTPGVWWSSHTDGGTEYDDANAWVLAERNVTDEIMYGAMDFEDWATEDNGGVKWKDGRPPKYPRSTPAMIRAIERHASEQKRQEEERRQARQQWQAKRTAA